MVWTSEDYCQLKKSRYLKLRNLALFYVWEDVKSLVLLKSFLSYTSRLSGGQCPVFLTPPPHPCSLVLIIANGCQIAGIVLLPGCPLGSEIHVQKAGITSGCGILVYSYGRKYSISHPHTCMMGRFVFGS